MGGGQLREGRGGQNIEGGMENEAYEGGTVESAEEQHIDTQMDWVHTYSTVNTQKGVQTVHSKWEYIQLIQYVLYEQYILYSIYRLGIYTIQII